MKVLVTGVAGQLGWDVVNRLRALRIDCLGVDREDFDLTDLDAALACVKEYQPDAIIHCAAYTNVDRAETEPEVCAAVNGMGTLNMARAALAVNAKLLYVSTDYVFSGDGERPFETGDPYGAQNVYGLTKQQGEEAIRSVMTRYFIVRASWVFGVHGNNFVRAILRRCASGQPLRVVADQIGSPTYSEDLAALLCDMIQTDRYGVYHATNEGFCSWADFARAIVRLSGSGATVTPVTTAEYGAPARRPANSRLSKRSLDENGFARLPSWEDALERYMRILAEQK